MGLFFTCGQNKFITLCKRKRLTLSELINFQDLSTYRKPLNFLEVLLLLDVQMIGWGHLGYCILSASQDPASIAQSWNVCELLEWAGLFWILLRESRQQTAWAWGGAITFHTAMKQYHKGELSSLTYKSKPVLFRVGGCCTKSGQSLHTVWQAGAVSQTVAMIGFSIWLGLL